MDLGGDFSPPGRANSTWRLRGERLKKSGIYKAQILGPIRTVPQVNFCSLKGLKEALHCLSVVLHFGLQSFLQDLISPAPTWEVKHDQLVLNDFTLGF